MNRADTLVTRMAEEIIKQVKGYALQEPVYGLIVCYSTENGAFPPWIALGTARERAQLSEECDPEDLYALLWSGENLELYDPIEALEENTAFLDDYAAWLGEAESDGLLPERATSLALRVCFALAKADWPDICPVTGDFAVLCNDQKCEWLWDNAEVLLDEAQKHALREKYYLPG